MAAQVQMYNFCTYSHHSHSDVNVHVVMECQVIHSKANVNVKMKSVTFDLLSFKSNVKIVKRKSQNSTQTKPSFVSFEFLSKSHLR